MTQGLLSLCHRIFLKSMKVYKPPKQPSNCENGSSNKKDLKKSKYKKSNIWAIKITIITLFLALIFSFITEITASKSNVVIAMMLLFLLIVINIIFDGVGIAAASCDIAPLLSMSSRKVPGAKIAVMLVKNAEKVSNICADVIGDICGIISGAFTITIIIKLAEDNPNSYLFNILLASVVAALTVGGKAFIKTVAIRRSRDVMLFASRIVSIFYKPRASK